MSQKTYTSSIYVKLGNQPGQNEDTATKTVELEFDPQTKTISKDRKISYERQQEQPPEFVIKPRRQFVNEGQSAKFKASFEGSRSTVLTWSKDGKVLHSSRRNKIYIDERDVHVLEIKDVSSKDGGIYTCTIRNSAGTAKTTAELDVYTKPRKLSIEKGYVAPSVDSPLFDTKVSPGDKNVTLECKFSNAIDAITCWYKDGQPLKKALYSKQTFDGRLCRLLLIPISDKHDGKYECSASNTGGEVRTCCRINVMAPGTRSIPPKFISPLSDQTLCVGDRLVLESKVTGFPQPTIKWYKNQEEIKSSRALRTEFDGSTVRLIMENVEISDSDTYKCIAENDVGIDQIKAKIVVQREIIRKIGNRVEIIQPSFEEPTDSANQFSASRSYINQSSPSNTSHDIPQDSNIPYNHTELPVRELSREPPTFIRELHDLDVKEDDPVELLVEVKGTPPIELVWVHNNSEVNEDHPVYRVTSSGNIQQLVIPRCKPEDAGEIVCEAYNEYGEIDTYCCLSVQESTASHKPQYSSEQKAHVTMETTRSQSPSINQTRTSGRRNISLPEEDRMSHGTGTRPEFILKPHSASVEQGKSAIFLCRPQGDPRPRVQWKKNDVVIKSDDKFQIVNGEDSILEIRNVTAEDCGIYTCLLQNSVGSVSTEIELSIGRELSKTSTPDSSLHVKTRPEQDSPKRGGINKKIELFQKSEETSSQPLIKVETTPPRRVQTSFGSHSGGRASTSCRSTPKSSEKTEDFRDILNRIKPQKDRESSSLSSLRSKDSSLSSDGFQSGLSRRQRDKSPVKVSEAVKKLQASQKRTESQGKLQYSRNVHFGRLSESPKSVTGRERSRTNVRKLVSDLSESPESSKKPDNMISSPKKIENTNAARSVPNKHISAKLNFDLNAEMSEYESRSVENSTESESNKKNLSIKERQAVLHGDLKTIIDKKQNMILHEVNNESKNSSTNMPSLVSENLPSIMKKLPSPVSDKPQTIAKSLPSPTYEKYQPVAKTLPNPSSEKHKSFAKSPTSENKPRRNLLAEVTQSDSVEMNAVFGQKYEPSKVKSTPEKQKRVSVFERLPDEQNEFQKLLERKRNSLPASSNSPIKTQSSGSFREQNSPKKKAEKEADQSPMIKSVMKQFNKNVDEFLDHLAQKPPKPEISPQVIGNGTGERSFERISRGRNLGETRKLGRESSPHFRNVLNQIEARSKSEQCDNVTPTKTERTRQSLDTTVHSNVLRTERTRQSLDNTVHSNVLRRRENSPLGARTSKSQYQPVKFSPIQNSELNNGVSSNERNEPPTKRVPNQTTADSHSATFSNGKDTDTSNKDSTNEQNVFSTHRVSKQSNDDNSEDKCVVINSPVKKDLSDSNLAVVEEKIEMKRIERVQKLNALSQLYADDQLEDNYSYNARKSRDHLKDKNDTDVNEVEKEDLREIDRGEEIIVEEKRSSISSVSRPKVSRRWENPEPAKSNGIHDHDNYRSPEKGKKDSNPYRNYNGSSNYREPEEFEPFDENMSEGHKAMMSLKRHKMSDVEELFEDFSRIDRELESLKKNPRYGPLDDADKQILSKISGLSGEFTDESQESPSNSTSEDFRSTSVLSKKSSKYSTKFNFEKSPASVEQLDFRHVLKRHVEPHLRQLPKILVDLADVKVKEGQPVTLECQITGIPKPEVAWAMNNKRIKKTKIIQPSKFFRMTYEDNKAKLVIAGAYPEDDGEYVCSATNSLGTARCSCHLYVEESNNHSNEITDEEGPVGTSFNQNSTFSSHIDSPVRKISYSSTETGPSTQSFEPQKSYDQSPSNMPSVSTSYDDSNFDEFEDSFEMVKKQAPRIHEINPRNPMVEHGQKLQLQVSFTAEPKPVVRWFRDSFEIIPNNFYQISTTEHFSRLIIEQSEAGDSGNYNAMVENDIGSDAVDTRVTVLDVPSSPSKPYATETTLFSIILSWSAPQADGGSPVKKYKIEMCNAEEEDWETLTENCSSTSYCATDLAAHNPFFFRISAKNRIGFSKPSPVSDVIVTKDSNPTHRLSVDSDDVFSSTAIDVESPISPFLPQAMQEEELPFTPRTVVPATELTFEDHYEKIEEVGKGKFGFVYKCFHKEEKKVWAAKVIKCRKHDERLNVKNEISIMNELTHPKLLLLRDAYETPRSMVLVMEYIGGGELFDRVADEDLELTERDCVHFMRQICAGVSYMHDKSIMHLDLKPENILCVRKDSNLIKIIDFGLARRYTPGESLKVMFGTPEFIAPEVVNYEQIGLPTDIWSLGVICYVLLSGLSPFMGDSDGETLSNVTQGDFDFDDEAFDEISHDAKDFIEKCLNKNMRKRLTISDCANHKWLAHSERNSSKKLRQSLRNLKQFMARRKWQKMGTAIRAIGRMANWQKQRGDSDSHDKSHDRSINSTSDSDIASQSDLSVVSLSRPPSHGRLDSRGDNQDISDTTETDEQDEEVFHETKDDKISCESDRCENCENNNKHFKMATHSESSSPAEITKDMLDVESMKGDVVRFDVTVDGSPCPDVQWLHGPNIIKEDTTHSFIQGKNGICSLVIRDICKSDEGEYTCKVTNLSGEDSCSAELFVYGDNAF